MSLPDSKTHYCLRTPPRLSRAQIPRYALAVLKALQFTTPDLNLLAELDESEWKQLLHFCDTAQLTLLIRDVARDVLPDWVRARVDGNYRDNETRFNRLKSMALELSVALAGRSIDFTMLKGFAHSPVFTPDPLLRAQGDIDLWCLAERVFEARDVLFDLGYRPVMQSDGRHLDPMARPTAWTWRGDFFDPDLPIPVDLHYTLWDQNVERIPGLHEDQLWSRRSKAALGDISIAVLAGPDALAFAALHAMMHVFHGSLRLQRVWELAYVLKDRAEDEGFWLAWQRSHAPEARTLQVTAFLLADHWFQCGLPELIESEAQSISPDVRRWIARYGFSPIEALFFPNKDELWLNLCLLDSIGSKISVFCRRVLPVRSALTQVIGRSPTEGDRNGRDFRRAYLSERFWMHARTLVPTCVAGLKWWWLRQQRIL